MTAELDWSRVLVLVLALVLLYCILTNLLLYIPNVTQRSCSRVCIDSLPWPVAHSSSSSPASPHPIHKPRRYSLAHPPPSEFDRILHGRLAANDRIRDERRPSRPLQIHVASQPAELSLHGLAVARALDPCHAHDARLPFRFLIKARYTYIDPPPLQQIGHC